MPVSGDHTGRKICLQVCNPAGFSIEFAMVRSNPPPKRYPFTMSRTSRVSGISSLQDCREFWEIPVEGNVGMDQDPGKPFSGDNRLKA